MTAEEKMENVFQELERIVTKLSKEVRKEKIVIEKNLFFNEELVELIEEKHLRGVIHAYNSILISDQFQNYRQQEKVICLQGYLIILSTVVEEERSY